MKQAHQHTAASSPFLALAKKTWNAPIYREILRLFNEEGQKAADRYIARHRCDPKADRKEARAALTELLELHFKALNSTKSPSQRDESRMGFHYQLEEVRELLISLERSVDR